MATKAQLVKTAKELNKLFFEEPQIDEKGTKATIQGIMEAMACYAEGDELSEESTKVLRTLKWEEFLPTVDDSEIDPTTNMTEKATLEANLRHLGVWVNEDEEAPVPEEEAPKKAKKATPAKPKKEKPAPAKKKKEPRVTKKMVVEELIARKNGATIEEIAQAIVDKEIDLDYEKNCKVVKLWLAKMGFDTKKKSIEENPRFKAK